MSPRPPLCPYCQGKPELQQGCKNCNGIGFQLPGSVTPVPATPRNTGLPQRGSTEPSPEPRCDACGKTYGEHTTANAIGPRLPQACQDTKRGFRPRLFRRG